ncbi:MAG: lipid biosynthesis B12-binding/radical SAM protein [Nitrospirota bacterium]
MKILFISVNNEQEPYPVAPLGAAYVASFLKERGDETTILDLCFVEDDFKSIEVSLSEFSPDLIGISLRNIDNLTFNRSVYYMPRIRSVVNFLKSKTSAEIIVGGSGYSIFPEEVLRYLDLSIGIAGAGENAFALLADAIKNGSSYDDIPNVCCLKDGEFRANKIKFNNSEHMPDRSLLDNRKYLDFGGMANIQSKRGCPFHCSYCTYPSIDGNQLRLREPAAVVDELKEMHDRHGIDHVFFVDDIFNFPEDHAVRICEEILRRELVIDWTCFATPLGMTEQLAVLMKRAGCSGVEFGSDAITDVTLKGLGKQFTSDEISAAAEACGKAKMPNAHYLIIGGPGENDKTLDEAFSFFDKVSPTAVIALAGLRIYPNTELHQKAIDDGLVDKDNNLLEPAFYLSPALNADEMFRKLAEKGAERHNWIVPGLNIRYDPETMKMLRKMNKRGSLWTVL